MVFVFIALVGFTTIGTANNPKQNVKSHSYGNKILISSVHKNQLHVPWHTKVTQQTVVTTTTTVAAAATPPPTVSTDPSVVTPEEEAAWGKVPICEEGGNWSYQGSVYSGGLGMLNSTWVAYGGLQFAPNAGLATMDQQIIVAERIQSIPPDQNGCSGSW